MNEERPTSPVHDDQRIDRSRAPILHRGWLAGGALVGLLVLALVVRAFVFGPEDSTPTAPELRSDVTTETDQLTKEPRPMGASNRRTADPRRLTADPGEAPLELPERGLVGTVTNVDGQPIENAEVRLFRRDPDASIRRGTQGAAWPPDATTTTDPSGRFSFAIERSGSNRFQLLVRHTDYASSRGFADLGPNEGLVDVGNFELVPGQKLLGQVVLARNGLPVRDAVVTACYRGLRAGDPPAPEPLRRAVTGFDGAFELSPLPRTSIEIEVRSTDYPGLLHRIDLSFDRPLEPLRLELRSPNRLAGRVLDELGLPIEGAEIEAEPIDPRPDDTTSPADARSFSDPDGWFGFDNLPPGSARIRVRAAGHRSIGFGDPVAVGREDLEFRLETLPRIAVIVRDPRDRTVRNYDLRMLQPLGSSPDWLAVAPGTTAWTITSEDLQFGQALVGPLPVGDTVLEIRAEGFATSYSEVFDPQEWPVGRPLEVRLRAGARITGLIRDHRDRPVEGAVVRLRPDPETTTDDPAIAWAREFVAPRGSSRELTTDDQGRFTIDRISAARYRLEVEHPDLAFATTAPIQATDGNENDLGVLFLTPGVLVSGSVRFDGVDAARASVRVYTEAGPGSQRTVVLTETRTDAEGRFVLPRRLPAGDYRLSVARESGSALQVLLDQRRSERALTVRGEEPILELPIEISTRR